MCHEIFNLIGVCNIDLLPVYSHFFTLFEKGSLKIFYENERLNVCASKYYSVVFGRHYGSSGIIILQADEQV